MSILVRPQELGNLTLQSFFQFGLHQDDIFRGVDVKDSPSIFEDRVREIYKPLMLPQVGNPDLVIFGTFTS